ncbi:hypothetical protein [Actinomadura craniellae]|nr:hypothetical protein [Actinomadura craniellae]
MEAEGLVPNGPHHEIYLSDPAEPDPAKMRTSLSGTPAAQAGRS